MYLNFRWEVNFNSRPRVGGDPSVPPCQTWAVTFQFTPPRGGRRGCVRLCLPAGLDFNSRPRVGGDAFPLVGAGRNTAISIHAPAWGATRSASSSVMPRVLFQFTPPRGGRRTSWRCHTRWARNFNSRPRVGGRPSSGCSSPSPWLISIHAPAWGATDKIDKCICFIVYFNSRPRVGGDQCQAQKQWIPCQFQFTPPRGGRLDTIIQEAQEGYFNSRPRVGGDTDSPRSSHKQRQISIHAPAWGATTEVATHIYGDCISIHAPAWGATRCGSRQTGFRTISIHAPAWGATGSRPALAHICIKFQFTPPRGGRRHPFPHGRF